MLLYQKLTSAIYGKILQALIQNFNILKYGLLIQVLSL